MHIPDGYLSPTTCVALYASSMPFWAVALRRVKSLLHTRFVPLLSVFAAFSFVIMMFNLPLPGGTTGHAVGIGIATIVLGPWASMLAISVALLIQALFFGDGGILAFGANSFNMAIVGSLVAYVVYRTVAGDCALTARRRVVAAVLAGYTAINAAALCAAIEFGVQPALFKAPDGTPLYCPYPLHIAVPAMMLGHLTFAGLAEGLVAGGIVAYLQRNDLSLLKLTGHVRHESGALSGQHGWRTTRPLWIGLVLLTLLSPLGLLAAGTAWGEWAPEDFHDATSRQEMTMSSRNTAPPLHPPEGLERLSSFWTAPLPDYELPFLANAVLGYIFSAFLGVCLVMGAVLLFRIKK
jgi:cobalt/nickel transport system permease protein